ncbi:hypothetical protein [Endozoicomonas arenosclerae]|uniref:hypothetical protein n=1 Tax=Endozoicomonas arenosclerae TaxID=1633495 RepID=UPI000783DF19|nr:hypothetical protein [Endozoicomonas arenosclerae]
MMPLPNISTGNIPGNVGNAGPSTATSGANGRSSGENILGNVRFGGLETEELLIVGGLLLLGVVLWKKL